MSAETSIYEQIERYISGIMEPEEKQAFEAALNRDRSLTEKMLAYKKLNEEFSVMEQSKAGEEALSGTLQQMNQKYFTAPKKITGKPAPVRRMVFAVAAAASIIAAFFLLKPVLFNTGNKNLFNEYYPAEQMTVERGAVDSGTEAAKFYNAKEYTKALQILEPFTKAHPEKTELQVFTGRSYLETAAYAQADSVFSAVANGTSLFRDKAQFLRAMVMLKQKRNEECKAILAQIPASSSYYTTANELMRKL